MFAAFEIMTSSVLVHGNTMFEISIRNQLHVQYNTYILKRSQTFQTDKAYCGVFQRDVKLFHRIPWYVVMCQKESRAIAALVFLGW